MSLDNDELRKIFNDVLDSREYIKGGELAGHFISQDNIEVIERNISFFRDIPSEDLINEVFISLIWKIFNYCSDFHYDTSNKHNKRIKKPSILIKQHLKKLYGFQEVLEYLLPILKTNDEKKYIYIKTPDNKALIEVHKEINKLIQGYENNEPDIKSKYYVGKTSKSNIKDFLEEIVQCYKLNNVSLEKKSIIDEIKPFKVKED